MQKKKKDSLDQHLYVDHHFISFSISNEEHKSFIQSVANLIKQTQYEIHTIIFKIKGEELKKTQWNFWPEKSIRSTSHTIKKNRHCTQLIQVIHEIVDDMKTLSSLVFCALRYMYMCFVVHLYFQLLEFYFLHLVNLSCPIETTFVYIAYALK